MRRKQAGVALGMAAALALTVAIFVLFGAFTLAGAATRAQIWAVAALGPLACLAVCVAVLASFRFFSRPDIDAAAGGLASGGAIVRQAIVQNTLEQAVLAIGAYGALLALDPRVTGLPLILAATFIVGRIAFAAGYGRGAAARSFGFALTFYPTVGALALAGLFGLRLLG